MVSSLQEINNMDGHRFENLCAEILQYNDFSSVEVTRGSGDYGVDITAYKYGKKYAIQCKRHKNQIGIKAVQEVLAGAKYYDCNIPVVLTNSTDKKERAFLTRAVDGTLEQMIRTALPKDEEKMRQIREDIKREYMMHAIKRDKKVISGLPSHWLFLCRLA